MHDDWTHISHPLRTIMERLRDVNTEPDQDATAEDWQEYRDHKRRQRERRYTRAESEFEFARRIASSAGLVLIQHSDAHYSLRAKNWIQNIYPGNRRLYHDLNRATPPFLKLPYEWTLLDVVRAAVEVERSQLH